MGRSPNASERASPVRARPASRPCLQVVMLRNLALVGLLTGASGTAVELTEKNWDEVISARQPAS